MLFRRAVLLAAILATGCVSPRDDANTPVCSALRRLVSETGVGETITTHVFLLPPSQDTIFAIACNHKDDARSRAFCDVVLDNTSFEFINVFAYQVRDCVAASGRIEDTETSAERSGLRYHPHTLVALDGSIGRARINLRRDADAGYNVTVSKLH